MSHPSCFALRKRVMSSGRTSSPSPMRARSIKSATGSALYMAVPPATIRGRRSGRSWLRRGSPARSSMFSIAV